MSRLSEALEKARREGIREEPAAIAGPRAIAPVPSITPLRFVEGAVLTPELDGCLTELLREDEPWSEQFRTLATRLRAMEGSDQVRRIGLMSAASSEGKTTLALALSLILAEEQGDRVLLIDADLRQRAMTNLLETRPASGLGDWLKKPHLHLETRQIGPRGPFFLSAGQPCARPWELIASPHLANLLDVAGGEFRYVIVDCPAEGPVADAGRIQAHLDGLLLVVRARRAPRDAILTTLTHLDEEKMLGVIFNGEAGGKRRFHYYRHSGYAERKRDPKRGKGRRSE